MTVQRNSGRPRQPHSGDQTPNVPPPGAPSARPPVPPAGAPKPGPSKPPSRAPFWLGFVTSFLFLSVVSIGLLLLSTGVNGFDLATLQGGEAAWTPPEIVPTPTPDESVVGEIVAANVGEGAYDVGTTLRNITNTNVRIRQTPGNLSKPDGDIIAGIPVGGTAEVIGGPATADGLIWWYIRYTLSSGQVIEGWSAEATPSGLRILGPDQ
ncbi:MAG: hypothetical protein R2932_26225 [Caldilineaceae bacterium]